MDLLTVLKICKEAVVVKYLGSVADTDWIIQFQKKPFGENVAADGQNVLQSGKKLVENVMEKDDNKGVVISPDGNAHIVPKIIVCFNQSALRQLNDN